MASMGTLFLLGFMNSVFADDRLFIVANQKSLDLAKDFITSLNNESISLSVVLDQYDKVKKEKYVIVLGGANEFIKQILTKEDIESANQAGGKIFIKPNVFVQDQVIVVFAGSDESAAAEARKNSRKTWWALVAKWFEIDTSGPMAY